MARRRNAKGQFVKGSDRSGKSRRSNRRSPSTSRRGVARHDRIKAEDVVGGALVLAGLAVPVGGDTPMTAAVQGRTADAIYQVGERVPLLASPTAQANDGAALVAGGVAVKAIGWAARKLGHRTKHSIKFGKYRVGI